MNIEKQVNAVNVLFDAVAKGQKKGAYTLEEAAQIVESQKELIAFFQGGVQQFVNQLASQLQSIQPEREYEEQVEQRPAAFKLPKTAKRKTEETE